MHHPRSWWGFRVLVKTDKQINEGGLVWTLDLVACSASFFSAHFPLIHSVFLLLRDCLLTVSSENRSVAWCRYIADRLCEILLHITLSFLFKIYFWPQWVFVAVYRLPLFVMCGPLLAVSTAVWPQWLRRTGLVTLTHVESSHTGAQTHAPALTGRFLTARPPGKSSPFFKRRMCMLQRLICFDVFVPYGL